MEFLIDHRWDWNLCLPYISHLSQKDQWNPEIFQQLLNHLIQDIFDIASTHGPDLKTIDTYLGSRIQFPTSINQQLPEEIMELISNLREFGKGTFPPLLSETLYQHRRQLNLDPYQLSKYFQNETLILENQDWEFYLHLIQHDIEASEL